jgi:Domain of unknown function (DUF4411)
MTLYLLDANVLIRAHEDYYPIDRIPAFWTWILEQGARNVIKMPRAIFDEVTPAPGPFRTWLAQRAVRDTLVLNETISVSLVRQVIEHGYGHDLTDIQQEAIGKDPFLVAAAMTRDDRTVVTTEVSRPSRKRHNRKLPDVCSDMGIKCIHPFELYRILKFSIG